MTKSSTRDGDGKILDIAHISFLDMIQALIAQAGPAAAKGTLMRTAINAGSKMEPVNFATFDDFVSAIDGVETPIAEIEGRAVHLGNGVFGLPRCPFATSIGNYKEVFGGMPDSYSALTKEFNKPGNVARDLRVGHGAGVSPFCSVHQPMRSAIGERITIGGKPIRVRQLGCKSGSGEKGFAEALIEEAGVDRETVDKALDSHMCCYQIEVVD